MNEALFRIGGVYRRKDGWPVELRACDSNIHRKAATIEFYRGTEAAAVRDLKTGARLGYVRLSDGLKRQTANDKDSPHHLIPGELTQRDGQWVPVEEAKAIPDEMTFEELVADLLSPADAAMIARDGPAKFNPRAFPAECERMTREALGTAKPAIAALTRSPDLTEAKHQVCPDHALAAVRWTK